jgi:putative hydroxymethylpyrimidine transport system substrate-binding protein
MNKSSLLLSFKKEESFFLPLCGGFFLPLRGGSSFLKKRSKKLLPIACVILALVTPAKANDKLTVLLDWFVNPNHGPLIVAQAIGAFQRQGLDVEFVEPADPSIPPRLVAAGHGDIAIGYQPQLYQQVAQGLQVVRIGALIDRPMETLETLQSSGIKTIGDLKGKRIGYNNVGGDVNLADIAQILSTAGLSLKDITLVNIGTALTTSLLAGQVDAVGVDRNFETFELIDHGAKPHGFDYEAYGVPAFDDLIMIVQKSRAHDPVMARFLRAVAEGGAYIRAHPDQAWADFIKLYPNDDNALNLAAWRFTIGCFATDPFALDGGKYNRFADFLVRWGVIPKALPVGEYAVQLK